MGCFIDDPRDPVFAIWRRLTPEERRAAAAAPCRYMPDVRRFYADVGAEDAGERYACPLGAAGAGWGPFPDQSEVAIELADRLPIASDDEFVTCYDEASAFIAAWDTSRIPPATLRLALRLIDEEADRGR